MKKYEPIFDHSGNILVSSDEVAKTALPFEITGWVPTGIAFRTSEGSLYDVRGFDLDRGLCIGYNRKHDLSVGGGF